MNDKPQYDALEGVNIDALIAHPYWEQIDEPLHGLIMSLPQADLPFFRTTALSWLYQNEGVLTFNELAEKISTDATTTYSKRLLRVALRGMERIHLLTTVHFPGEGDDVEELAPGEAPIGANTLISITWTGMVWLRRAWAARSKMLARRTLEDVHQQLCDEEDEGKAIEPVWVENLSGKDPEVTAIASRASLHLKNAISSVFQLGQQSDD